MSINCAYYCLERLHIIELKYLSQIWKRTFIVYVEVLYFVILPSSSAIEFRQLARILRETLQNTYNKKFLVPDNNSHPYFSLINTQEAYALSEDTLVTSFPNKYIKRGVGNGSADQISVNVSNASSKSIIHSFVDNTTGIQKKSDDANSDNTIEAPPNTLSPNRASRSVNSNNTDTYEDISEDQTANTLNTSRYSRAETDIIDDYDYNYDEMTTTIEISTRDSGKRELDDPESVNDDDVSDDESQTDESLKRGIDDFDSSTAGIVSDVGASANGDQHASAPEKRDADNDDSPDSEDTDIAALSENEDKSNEVKDTNTESSDSDAAAAQEMEVNSEGASLSFSTAVENMNTDESSISTSELPTSSSGTQGYSTLPIEMGSSLKDESVSEGVDDLDVDKLYNLLENVIPALLSKFIEIKPEVFNGSNEDSLTNILLTILPELIGNIVTDRPHYFLKTKRNESNKNV